MTTVQKYTKNVVAIHELPLHFLCCTQLKTAIMNKLNYQLTSLVKNEKDGKVSARVLGSPI